MSPLLVVAQGAALLILLRRLASGARRVPPVEPLVGGLADTSVSILVPTLNEGERLAPCLEGLGKQGAPLSEVIVVDSHSTDGTRAIVEAASQGDPRIRMVNHPPLPAGWIGKVWALQHGLSLAKGDWILGLDADIEPVPGMVAAVVAAARDHGLSMVSFSPTFAGQSAGERWLQPSLLLTLVYRFGAPARGAAPDRLMANGQCFLARREVLLAHGGYEPARRSFADDVALSRHYARAGVAVGFLDGSRLYRVRSYRSAGELWREWGRSIDLADTTSRLRQGLDLLFLALVQGLPVVILALFALGALPRSSPWLTALLWVNLTLLGIRLLMLLALGRSYERRGVPYALSWMSDPLAVVRVVVSTVRRPRSWRGRKYR